MLDLAIIAAKQGKLSTVTRYYERAQPSLNDLNALLVAASSTGQVAIVQFLILQAADPRLQNFLALKTAADCGYVELVDLFLQYESEHGVLEYSSPIHPVLEALELTCRSDFVDVVDRLLLDPRLQNMEIDRALFEACRRGHVAVTRRLLLHPTANPAANSCAAFHVAVKYGHAEIVDLLLAWKPDRDQAVVDPCSENDSAIYIAAVQGYDRILSSLLSVSGLSSRRRLAVCTFRSTTPNLDSAYHTLKVQYIRDQQLAWLLCDAARAFVLPWSVLTCLGRCVWAEDLFEVLLTQAEGLQNVVEKEMEDGKGDEKKEMEQVELEPGEVPVEPVPVISEALRVWMQHAVKMLKNVELSVNECRKIYPDIFPKRINK